MTSSFQSRNVHIGNTIEIKKVGSRTNLKIIFQRFGPKGREYALTWRAQTSHIQRQHETKLKTKTH